MIKIDLSLPIALALMIIPIVVALPYIDWSVLGTTLLIVLLTTMFVLGGFLLSYIIQGRI